MTHDQIEDKDAPSMGLVKVDLYTRDGGFVARVDFLPYVTPPDAILWGSRFFMLRPDSDDQGLAGKYCEGFVHYVVPRG